MQAFVVWAQAVLFTLFLVLLGWAFRLLDSYFVGFVLFAALARLFFEYFVFFFAFLLFLFVLECEVFRHRVLCLFLLRIKAY